MSLPVKDVAEAMVQNSQNLSNISRRKSMTINYSQLSQQDNSASRYIGADIPSSKMPSTHVNEGKLKMVLQQLKKADRNVLHTSR